MLPVEIDYSRLDPGIVKTVRLLRKHGFNTTDSGDGCSKDMGDYLDYPHVFMTCAPDKLVSTCDNLLILLDDHVPDLYNMDKDAVIQGTYSPLDATAVIVLIGIDDSMLSS